MVGGTRTGVSTSCDSAAVTGEARSGGLVTSPRAWALWAPRSVPQPHRPQPPCLSVNKFVLTLTLTTGARG